MSKKQLSYQEAMQQLEKILSAIEKNELDVDELSENVKTATQLISLCKDKLYKTEEEVNKIIENQSNIKE